MHESHHLLNIRKEDLLRRKALERFDTVADCDSILATRDVVFDGGKFAIENPPAIISSNACNLKHGVRMSDLGDLWSHISGVLGGIKEYENSIFYRSTPITPGQNAPDFFLYGVHENVSAWAAKRKAFAESEGGAGLGRHFQSVIDCTTSLWFGKRVIE